MKPSIIQNLKQTNSLRKEFVLRIVTLTISLSFLLVGTLLFVYQYNSNSKNFSRREAIQKIISTNLISSAKYGDIIYARAESIQLGKELGLVDLGICINQRDIFERVNDTRCKNSNMKNVDITRSQLLLGSEKYEIEFTWSKEDISLSKSILVALITSLVISLFIVFPTFYYLLKKFHSKMQNVILTLLDRHSSELDVNQATTKVEVPEEFIDLDNIIEKKNQELRKATSDKVYYELSKKVSHDIRSPLKVINEFSKKITSQLQEDKVIFNHAISRINSIAEDLLKGNNQISFSKELISVKDVISYSTNITKEKKVEFKSKTLTIELLLGDLDLNQNLYLDVGTFSRILSNLINNAQESIEIKNELNGKIQIMIKSISDYLSIQIIDNGIGLKEEFITKIKNNENITSTKGGNGIGLSSAIHYLKYQGGYMDIYANQDAGCVVEMFFALSTHLISTVHSIDFIFIDDEQLNHLMWKKKAQQKGLSGIFLKTVDECLNLKLHSKEMPIFLDYFLDNQNGILEAQKLHQHGFKNIYICTNFQLDNITLPDYIKGSVEKEYINYLTSSSNLG